MACPEAETPLVRIAVHFFVVRASCTTNPQQIETMEFEP